MFVCLESGKCIVAKFAGTAGQVCPYRRGGVFGEGLLCRVVQGYDRGSRRAYFISGVSHERGRVVRKAGVIP